VTGLTPRGSWCSRDQGVGKAAEELGLGTSCREGDTNAAGRLGDTGGDFEVGGRLVVFSGNIDSESCYECEI